LARQSGVLSKGKTDYANPGLAWKSEAAGVTHNVSIPFDHI
jgi:hypothetical protein